MAATIVVGSGTFSTISASERPVAHRDTIEERYDFESLVAETDLRTNVGGFPELEQFVGLMAQAYAKPANACLVRLSRMIDILTNRTRIAHERQYTP